MTELPRKAVSRTARLAALPLGYAGRTALGVGKRIGGAPAEAVMTEVQQRTADQLFRTLGELKGGAMKVGQALSIMESVLPEEVAAPYRAQLTRLQDAAPPMSASTVHSQLTHELGTGWRRQLVGFDDNPAASASIGQVHRGRWADGREVAVKIQYPGAGEALMADLRQLSRVARTFGGLVPGMDVKPLITEMQARVAEELDYSLEAEAQTAFAAAFAGDPEFRVPDVVAHTDAVLVTEWMDSTSSLARLIAEGTKEQRDHFGELYVRFLFEGPARAGMLHADPHPGNFRLLDDGRLGVIDFGATARLPDGHPEPIGRLLRWALAGKADEVLADLRVEGFVRPSVEVDAEAVLDYLRPLLDPLLTHHFHFTRAWMQEQAARIADPRNEASRLGRQLNLPPAYLMIHRVTIGSIGVLCQLDAAGDFRSILEEWLPGFTE